MDSRVFEALYARHAANVYALACWLGERDEADDITQEVFLLVWRKGSTFKGSAEFGTWLRRVAVNVIFSRRRSLSSQLISSSDSLETDDRMHSTSGLGLEDKITFEDAVAGLPNGMREVFVLHDVEGYGHDEIARMLEIAVGTSGSRLHRARMLLKEVLHD